MKPHLFLPLIAILLFSALMAPSLLRNIGLPAFTRSTPKITTGSFEPLIPKTYKIPILLYHYVEYPSNPDDYIRKSLTVLPNNFEEQIKTLKTNGFTIIKPSDLYWAINNKKEISTKSVIITFDDGYRDFYTDAFPIIERNQIPVTVFVVTGLIGQPNYVTEEQIKELLKSKYVEIGYHGWSHKNIPLISEKEQQEEIFYGKKYFEDRFGAKLKYFAYPYGGHTVKTEQMAKDAGFMLAMVLDTETDKTESIDTLFRLSRVRVGNFPPAMFLEIIQKPWK